MKKDENELEEICKVNNIKITNSNKVSNFEYPKDKIFGKDSRIRNKILVNYKSSLILDIWMFLYNRTKV